MGSQQNSSTKRIVVIRLRRILLASCFFLVLSLCQGCTSQMSGGGRTYLSKSDASSRTARIAVKNTTYDFGTVRPGSKNTAAFSFRNTGDGALEITDVKGCCGAVVKLDKRVLMPGQTGAVIVDYNVGQQEGSLQAKVTLLTNDARNPQIELAVVGKIVRTLTWEPAHLTLSAGKGNRPCPDIVIRALDGTRFSIKGFRATGECITVQSDPTHRATEFTLKPTVDLAKLRALASSSGRVQIDLDHPEYKTISIECDITPPFEIIPRQIVAVNAKPGEPLLRSLAFRCDETERIEGTMFEVASVLSRNGSRVEVRSVKLNGTGCDILLAIWPRVSETRESFTTDQLAIQMKNGPELNVPVRVFYEIGPTSRIASPSPSL